MSDFQGRGPRDGRWFAQGCVNALENHGFRVQGPVKVPDIGVEIDAVAFNRQDVPIYFEYKGSIHGRRPGLWRTDTVKKAIANGYLLSAAAARVDSKDLLPYGPAPFVIITSHLPEEDKRSAHNMLKIVEREVVYLAFELTFSHGPLSWLAEADGDGLREDLMRSPILGERLGWSA